MIQLVMILSMLFQTTASAYDYSFTSIEGKTIKLSDFKGKQILIVNTASKCGFTKQYKELQELHEKYGKNLVVIGFPSGNFMGQEFNDNDDIQAFCEKNYGVTFLLSEKVEVKGKEIAPLFKYLTSAENPDFKGDINWNFEKFLIDKNGKLAHRYRSKVTPMSEDIIKNVGK